MIFGDDGGHNGNDDEERRSRAWNTGFWILKRIAQGKVKTDFMCVTFKVYPARIILENSMMSIMSELGWSEIGQLFSNTGFH